MVAERSVEAIKKLRERGIKVRILTNSLASNDVLAGHAEFREALLATGAQIYEIRADSGVIRKKWRGDSNANINTETGLYVDSPKLAAQVLAKHDAQSPTLQIGETRHV